MADKTTGQTVINALIIPMSSWATFPKPTPPPSGGGAHPDHTLPGNLPHPKHPIFLPLPPNAPVNPGYGIDVDAPHPDHTLPGAQPHPEHPIVLPPDSGGWDPVYIWGPTDPRPTPPIVIPPDSAAPPEAPGKVKWKAVWSPANGWQTVGVIIPSAPTPTPSKAR